jgi:hypothetical protein
MIKIEYGAITIGAKEGFVPELLNCSPISKSNDLSKDNLIFTNFGNPCEKYSVLLDGTSQPIPENTEDENIGVWSEYITDENGYFENEFPTIILTSDKPFDMSGLGLTFDASNNVYPIIFSVAWYNGDNAILEKEYQSSSVSFLTMEDIKNCDKIIIVFSRMNTPYSRLRLQGIEYGYISIIDGKSIKSIKLHQAANTISTTLPTSSMALTFLNSKNENYNFTIRQNLKIYDNDTLIGKYFIDSASQANKQEWNIKAQDYINILESTEFEGGIYFDELALSVLTDIFDKANVPFSIAEALRNKTITGYIPYTTCRKALQQVLFAIGGYANTAYSESVDVLENDLTIAENIGLDRVLIGQTTSIDADITEIELFGHVYTATEEEAKLYEATENQENFKIIFSEPIHDLTIENGEIVKSGTNYAIINCLENAVLKGKKYEHSSFSKSRYNSITKAKSMNKKIVKNATLISSANIDNILNICYNYIVRNKTVKSKIIETETPLVVGRAYEVETELLGKVSGVLTEQNFSLFGGSKVVKETVIK